MGQVHGALVDSVGGVCAYDSCFEFIDRTSQAGCALVPFPRVADLQANFLSLFTSASLGFEAEANFLALFLTSCADGSSCT